MPRPPASDNESDGPTEGSVSLFEHSILIRGQQEDARGVKHP